MHSFFVFGKKLYKKGGEKMPRARLSYEQRLYLEYALKIKKSGFEICKHLGISTQQLKREKALGWVKPEKRYSAEKAQLSLK